MYAELQCKTNFTFLDGASHAEELVTTATQLDYRALAITDVNSLSGVVRAHAAAKKTGLHLLIGAQIVPQDAPPVLLWATDRAAYGQLSQLITVGRRRAEKGSCLLSFQDIAEHASGLLAGIVPNLETNRSEKYRHTEAAYREAFGDRTYLVATLHLGPDDRQRIAQLQQRSLATRIPLVATGDVHYHTADRRPLQEILMAIRQGTTVGIAQNERFPNAERHLRPVEQIARLYTPFPDAVARTVEIADRCRFSLEQLRYEYPEELAPAGRTPFQYLEQLTWQGAAHRYPRGVPTKVQSLLQYELSLIQELHYEAYFLTVWDLVTFARAGNILCQGRGSAANSAVCYCLGVTAVDPDCTDVLFERFISRERNEAPDIDVDFEHERREEVLQYLYDKYGRDRAGLTAEVITYRLRSAIRDVGKALGLSLDRVDALSKQVEGRGGGDLTSGGDELALRCQEVGIHPNSPLGKRLVETIQDLIGFPRHLSQHVGGMVMTAGSLSRLVPIENAAMADRTVISWDKNDLDTLGILKVDCLALGMLTAIRKAFTLIQQQDQTLLTLADIPQDDPQVYEMICQADTMGVFQIESRAQMSMLPRLQPRCYYDLVIEVAIVRPGPIQGQMVHPYLRRRSGLEPVTYANDEVKAVLHKTLGVPIFQEQAMRLAVVAAGFTAGEADQLRRAMGTWRTTGVMDTFRHKLVHGMLARGFTQQFADQLFQQLRGFGEYGFPESHAASFALLVYVSAWIKYYYPAAFTAALINSQPMGFYAPAQLIRDVRKHGVPVLPVDVNHSDWDCTLEEVSGAPQSPGITAPFAAPPTVPNSPSHRWGIRLGMRLMVGFSVRHAAAIVAARRDRPFSSQEDFARRTRLPTSVITTLAQADAFASLGRNRRQALWESLAQDASSDAMPLFASLPAEDEPPVALAAPADFEETMTDYCQLGLTLRNHPLVFYREQLANLGASTAESLAEMNNGSRVTVAGLVIMRQRPSTAKGITFVTLEDETGVINLVVHSQTWKKFYKTARTAPAWLATGKLQSKHSVIHVVVERLADFSAAVSQSVSKLNNKSRDFR